MNHEEFKNINTDKIEYCNVSDQGGGCFFARTKYQKDHLNVALVRFRKFHLEFIRPKANEHRLFNLYRVYSKEMESYETDQITNYNEYTECLRIWGSSLESWVLSVYSKEEYINHLSFRDVLKEGVYESITEFNGSLLYWEHR